MEVIEQPLPLEFDFTTEAGVLAFVEDTLQNLRYLFSMYGYLRVGIVCIATQRANGTRTAPFALPMISEGYMDQKSLSAAFHIVAERCRAVGVLFFSESWVADFESEAQWAAWGNRHVREHPTAHRVLHVTFEHQTIGHRTWQARVTRDSSTRMNSVAPFELQNRPSTSPQRFSGFLAHLSNGAS